MSTIIKQAGSPLNRNAKSVQAVAFSFNDISSRADEYLTAVRDQATKIIADAHQQAESIRRQAEEAGRLAAQSAIERILDEKVAGQMETLRPAIEQLMAQLQDARGAWQGHWEKSAVKVATAIAERVIRREVRQQPEISLEFIREGLELAAGAAEVIVSLHPTDYASLGQQAQRLAESLGQLAPAEIIADPSVSLGGCRLVTKFGEIDQQIETQLKRIEEELT